MFLQLRWKSSKCTWKVLIWTPLKSQLLERYFKIVLIKSAEDKSEKQTSVAASGKYYFNCSKCFCFLCSTKLQQNNYLVKFSSTDLVLIWFAHFNFKERGESRTPEKTEICFSVTTANDSQLLTVVTKNFILDTADVLDPPLARLQYDSRWISPSQCSHQALHSLCFRCAK